MRYRAAVFTISDSRSAGAAEDQGGPAVVEKLPLCEATPVHRQIVPDDVEQIRAAVQAWIGRVDLIVTTGGTGVAPRDMTPEALAPLIEKSLPGFGEVMRLNAFEKTPTSVLSRGGAGTAGGTLLVWLPGSPKAVSECLTWLAPAIRHACRALRGDAGHGGNSD